MEINKDCIAIDGPGGVGKSTIAQTLAKKLDMVYLDTGAMYRAVGLKCLMSGVDPLDARAVAALVETTEISIIFVGEAQHVLLDGLDVEAEIRTPEASRAASDVAAHADVRKAVVAIQRDFAKNQSVVMDGRDIGTHVLPGAKHKFFLTASSHIRARRRYEELRAKGADVAYEQVLHEMVVRDEKDSTRAIAPLRPAEDAIIINTDALDIQGVLDIILNHIGEARA